jgi:DNA-binding transcriptional ArsR family regulator
MTAAADLVTWLRAAGEPTRLRLLALCAQREFSVSELALAVGQSGPRVSRHLKILCAAGLLARLRVGQWVHYRLAQDPAAAGFLQALVADLDPADPLLAPDRGRIKAAGVPAAQDPAARSRLDEALGSFITSSPGPGGTAAPSSSACSTMRCSRAPCVSRWTVPPSRTRAVRPKPRAPSSNAKE